MEMTVCMSCVLRAVALLVAVNGAPIIFRDVVGKRGNWPVDGGLQLADRQPLFGASKTWRGLFAGIAVGTAMAVMIGLPASLGAQFAFWVLAGDLAASFMKRRLRLKPSSRCRGLDVLPESLLPTWLLRSELGLNWLALVLVVTGFLLIEIYLSPLLFRWHIRKRPY